MQAEQRDTNAATPQLAVLLCGYRRHGKDTLARDMMRGAVHGSWTLCDPSGGLEDEWRAGEVASVAFASALKRCVTDELGVSVEQLELAKDEKVPGREETYRDVLIRVGAERRRADADVWCKKALLNERGEPRFARVVVTDFRFANELAFVRKLYPRVLTVRVCARSAEVPPYDVESEHTLDGLTTDALALPLTRGFNASEERDNFLRLFPDQGATFFPAHADAEK